MARQISTNPGVCIFNTKFKGDNSTTSFAPGTNVFRVTAPNGKNQYGKIMNAYFNMTWILTQMESLKNLDGKVSLYDLLTALCNGWNISTGSFNKLEVTIDNEEGIIRFVDEVSLPDRDSWLEKFNKPTILASFDVYGYYYGEGKIYDDKKNLISDDGYSKNQSHAGFIRDINFNTTIPSNLATMITVGATSNGYVVGQDSTALSRMNAGLVDRVKEKIETHQDTKTVGTGSLNNNYASAINSFQIFLSQLGSINNNTPTWNQEAINSFSNTAVTFYEYDQAKQTLEAAGLSAESASVAAQRNDFSALASSPSSPSIGFLPFDLQLTMDGLSGMKIYQKYTADASFLPSNYPSSLEFIIKGITNTISNNEWTTTLESIAVPKNPFGSSLGENAVVAGSNRDASRGTAPGTGNSNAVKGNASLRQVLINAGYKEGTAEYQFAYSIGTKEGWNANANGGVGTRSYRNNNPGNLDYSNNLKSIDPGVKLENNPYGTSRFAHFTTAELGAKALVESKIKKWANGNMPITAGNQSIIVNYRGGDKYQKGTNPTIAQFFFTYAPPTDGNNTEKYIADVIRDLSKIKAGINRNTLVKSILA